MPVFRKAKKFREEAAAAQAENAELRALMDEQQQAATERAEQLIADRKNAIASKDMELRHLASTVDGLRLDLAHEKGVAAEARARETEAREKYQMLTRNHAFHIGGKIAAHGNEPQIRWVCECGVTVAAPADWVF